MNISDVDFNKVLAEIARIKGFMDSVSALEVVKVVFGHDAWRANDDEVKLCEEILDCLIGLNIVKNRNMGNGYPVWPIV